MEKFEGLCTKVGDHEKLGAAIAKRLDEVIEEETGIKVKTRINGFKIDITNKTVDISAQEIGVRLHAKYALQLLKKIEDSTEE
jgi:hypothetical protein